MALPGDLNPAAKVLAGLDEVELTIEKLVAGGDGLARVDGVPIFVSGSVPGDRLRAEIFHRTTQYGRARILEVLEGGPGRRTAPCPHFEICGGCDLQQIEDELQPRLKAAAARETLERLGRLPDLPPSTLIQGAAWGYRTRAQLRTDLVDDRVRIGYFAKSSHDLVPVVECPVLVVELEDQLLTLASELEPGAPRRIDLAAGDDGAVTCSPPIEGQPRGAVRREVGGITYEYDARTFFQTHPGLLRDLITAVCGSWKGQRAFDLYAGVGLFTLPLAQRYDRVTAIESDSAAARYARRNARSNGFSNVDVHTQSLETSIQDLPASVDRVVVNPPRAGLSRRVSNMLALRRPRRVTYLSCHPATLARDLGLLREVYRVESLTFFDLFPQTGHLESLVQLILADG